MELKNTWKLLLIGPLFLSIGCRNNKDILSENISRLYVDYDVYTPNNLGVQFTGTVGVDLNSGETVELKNNKGFNSSLNFDAKIKDKKLSVYGPIPNYSTSKIPVQLMFTDKKNVQVTYTDSVYINFKGNTQAWYQGYTGSSGSAGSNGKTPLLFRDGTDGDPGGFGENGTNGDELEVYVWANGDTLFFYVNNVTRGYADRYKIIGSEGKFMIEANGGNGGSGGKGGDGGDGKRGEVSTNTTKLPGNGGRGGQGGQGGRGGNGGRVTVNVHPSAAGTDTRLIINVDGGRGGSGGDGGTGGKAGSPATGQNEGIKGVTGAKGLSGPSGVQGNVSVLTRTFDFTEYLH
jgi:hypothetical protein